MEFKIKLLELELLILICYEFVIKEVLISN